MIKSFRNYIKSEKLFEPGDNILLAVSGGVDSVAMVYLFAKSGYRFDIAHSNFGLRGKESEEDEKFVKNLAKSFGVQFFTKKFETIQFAEQQKISIQMAARDLRYAWFEQLMDQHGYAFVATAHHLDDQAETFFINLLRGTGISGLHGILPKQGRVIRPLMFATREKILNLAKNEALQWREDRSNSSRKYLRNKLRLDVISEMVKIKPDFALTLNETIKRLREAESIFNSHIAEVSADLVQHTPEGDLISIDWIYEYQPHNTYMFELLKPYNFTFPVVTQIVRSLDSFSGKVFYSPTHRLLRDRENLIIQPIESLPVQAGGNQYFTIDQNTSKIDKPVELTFLETEILANLPLGQPGVACFDMDKLTFPLILRKWKKGDWFIPFGNKGKKKLSDYFIDQKLSLTEKDASWILTSGEDIAWIVDRRIDNRFRITANTKRALIIRHVIANNSDDNPDNCSSLLFC